jgi:hypothetical protein
VLRSSPVFGQEKAKSDSINFSKLHFTQNKFVNNIFQQAINSVKKSPGPAAGNDYINGKSEDPYLPFSGKIIRHIYIEPFGFNRSLKDTGARDNSTGARIGAKFHRTTRKFVVKDNLFIEEHTPLNPFKVADNERHIRSLEFIQDARIVVDSIIGNPDSVDITIYTKDVFSIAGGAASDGLNHVNANLYDANFLGMGQRIEGSALYDYNRNPNWGYGALYRKTNILHSFIDGSIGASVMSISDYTHREESTDFITFNRRLVSPYSRFAGGITLSHNEAYNLYHFSPDSLAYRYKYDLFDVWGGYNIGIKKLTATNNSIRDRRFFALRYYTRRFTQVPLQTYNLFDPMYNSSEAVLGEFTFFRQDYYKTQYIYGFGTTEDLPYGYNIAVTGGWHRQLNLERPYAGIKISKYIATSRGDFIQLFMRTGGFLYNNKEIQDGAFLIGATTFGRLFFWNSTKIRPYINLSYASLYNRLTYAPLRINTFYGLRGFLSDSASGYQRCSLQLEASFYLKYKVLGFQFAPFPYADFAVLIPENGTFSKSSLYTSMGGGVRARNENLIFETIELRAYFFPGAPGDQKGFKIIIDANIHYRYSSNFIVAPNFVQLNDQ